MATQRRVYKYGTGHPIPDGARHVSTVTQTSLDTGEVLRDPMTGGLSAVWAPCWLVWHYYEVDVEVPDA